MPIEHNALVQILLATYQGETYLNHLIESLLDQTYERIEVLVRDDGSKDNTPAIIQKYQERYPKQIKVLEGGENRGILGNYSALAEQSTAPYVMFADQDDYWHASKVEVTLKGMMHAERCHGREKPILAHTDLMVVDQDLNTIDHSLWEYQNLDPSKSSLPQLVVQNHVTGCAMMANRALLKKALPIPSEAVMHDWWLALVAAAFGYLEPIKVSTICYRQHDSNDIGAKPYGLKSFLDRINMRVSRKPLEQARCFYKRYEDELDPVSKSQLKGYFQSFEASFFSKKLFWFKNGFVKHGLLRQLKQFILE